MAEALKNLQLYFSYPFVRYALIVGVLIAVCSSLLGVTLVLKRFSFIGDGLSHVAFGAMAIAAVLKFTNQTVVILPITVICAILLLKGGNSSKIRGDAAIAMLSVGALALGYLLMNIFSPSANVSGDVCSTLFGSTSILTLSRGEVILCAVLSLVVITMFILLYNKLFAVTFDESFSRATGVNTSAYNMLIAVITAVVIAALIVFPALSAMRLYKSFFTVSVFSAVFAAVCTALGMIISVLAGTPVGATVVAVDIAGFILSSVLGRALKRG